MPSGGGGGKPMVPAPIDRPLSRAYLREFSGWSTAFPPGLSEPTSLRVMENTMVNRDGSLRIRPGLRYLSYDTTGTLAHNTVGGVVGSHEVFYLNNGDKAYLFAVRESNGTVGFRVAQYQGDGVLPPFRVLLLTDPLVNLTALPTNFTSATTYVKYLQIDNKIIALSNAGEGLRIFYVGATKTAVTPVALGRPAWTVADKPDWYHLNNNAIADPVANPPNSNSVANASRTSRTLSVKNTDYDTVKNMIGYFYTFSNEVGESAASQVKVLKVQRQWQFWRWETMSGTYEPSGTDTEDPTQSCDQIAIYPDNAAWTAAKNNGATSFNVYAIMWSDQDPVPVEGMLVGTKTITAGLQFNDCWVRHSPGPMDASRTVVVPTETNRRDYSDPPKAGNGLVAADRLILVDDPTAGAVIRWTTNLVGEYTNFTAHRGGGYKTLTSGNLYIPATVKLWQNPQSVDTLTILCLGVDGQSTSFYMAPADITSQTDTTTVMAFEETTATPGTCAPYGVEVLNNALYHPTEPALIKSTAANYNINHATMTDNIVNSWQGLLTKQRIVSSQLDNRLYYLVNNPDGAPVEVGCWGNEVWVYDAQAKTGTWSRWLVGGQSLRKIEVDGRVVMSIVRPEGLYCFDESRSVDEWVDDDRVVQQTPIRWRIETNTQGANRAHDAWAHLQQVQLTLGNFTGTLRWGIRSYDVNGRSVEVSKVARDENPGTEDGLPWDLQDYLAVRRDLQEWSFYAESVEDDLGAALPSSGQISLVGYRYTPVSVNVGYEYGSVETFEYARSYAVGNNPLSINGVPVPAVDTRRP